MPRALARIGLLVGVGLLAAVTATAPASAAPAEDTGPVFETTTATAPPPVREATSPIAAKPDGEQGQFSPGSAIALHLDGACNVYANGTGDICLWRNQNFAGLRVDLYYNDPDFGNNTFPGGAPLANNTESGWNYDTRWIAHGCRGVNYTGGCGVALPGAHGNITPSFRWNVESLYWTLF
jgi:hypothetical protein